MEELCAKAYLRKVFFYARNMRMVILIFNKSRLIFCPWFLTVHLYCLKFASTVNVYLFTVHVRVEV
jgi:hypothetical protein